jgi:hypothetical protein
MRLRAGLPILMLLFAPASAGAADAVIAIEEKGFVPESVAMAVGDRLVVANRTGKKQWIWGQGGNYAFDYLSTAENGWTHEPGQTLGIIIPFAGDYRLGNAFDGRMHATIAVGR